MRNEISKIAFRIFPVLYFGICIAGAAGELNAPPQVIPSVQKWDGGSDALKLPKKVVIEVAAQDHATLDGVAEMLRADLAGIGYDGAIQSGGVAPGRIILNVGPVKGVPEQFAAEGYSLEIADEIRISAPTPTGVFYGTRTLLQMLEQSKDGQLPKGKIVDYPLYHGRMLMIDVARKPFPVWVLKDFIRMMSWYKMNELHLHLSDDSVNYSAFRIQSKRYPGLAAKDLSYSWEDLRDLQDFAEARGVVITPEIDMPGHAGSLTNYWPELRHPRGLLGKDKLDVTNPKTAEIMKSLLEEMIPLFDAPDFHIGTDEFGIGGSPEEKRQIGEAFRQFINTMNTFVRSKGKNCRIWSGFESMPGTTLPDPSVVIDMWVTRDAESLIDAGHRVINSSDGRTYLVPGTHYYGVNSADVFGSWEPFKIGGDPAKNPLPGDPHLLGGKLHIWNDQGPSGYTLTEIADLALPSMQSFAEKLWGHKGLQTYREFQQCAAGSANIPSLTILRRDRAIDADGIVFKLPAEQTLADVKATINLPWANSPAANLEYSEPSEKPSRGDLEYPWTLSMKIKPGADQKTRGIILSSDLVELCANYGKEVKIKEKGADGKEIEKKVTKVGVGIARAAGGFGKEPHNSSYYYDTDAVVADALPAGEWSNLTAVGLRRETQFFINGQFVGKNNNQMTCPLKRLGSIAGNSFVGSVKDLTVWNRALSSKEIGRSAGLDIPENLAAHATVTAFRSDAEHGFTADLMVDEDAATRWSSGPTGAEGWVIVDIGRPQSIAAVSLNFENAFARTVTLSISDDAVNWRPLATGPGSVGMVKIPFDSTRGRYVRVGLKDPGSPWGYSLWEVEVLGKSGSAK